MPTTDPADTDVGINANTKDAESASLLVDSGSSSTAQSLEKPSPNGTAAADKKCSPLPFRKESSQKKKLDKFYEKQNALLDKYEGDSKIVKEVARSRLSSVRPASSSTDVEFVEQNYEDGMERKVRHIVHQEMSPRITVIDRKLHDILPEGTVPDVPPSSPSSRGSLRSRDKSIDDVSMEDGSSAKRLAMITLIINVTLMLIKGVASYLSGSLSILSSLVDSAVDITSGLVIWMTARAIKKRDPYAYPRGRTRLEPLALVIVSVIMAVASVQMLVESINAIINANIDPTVDLTTLIIMVSTILIKTLLFISCKMHKNNASINVLAQDHRNDCVSNTVALLCAFGAQHLWLYLDPIGAILVSLYIAFTWFQTGKEQLRILSGRSAEPEFINRIIKLCIDHDEEIQFIDTVYVYHFGLHFLVEVHIVLDPEMSLKNSHDISESLQTKLEALPEVERAFVHCDYEFEHLPQDEHKVV
uniref:ZT_dimer domain-containing protein n=1 Tax=Panagrellus redivivus TaxID=6233 RepID=A0A7E4V095_PANRE